jgi:lipoprotein-anchoring transpeptidase ErfK/SrfK
LRRSPLTALVLGLWAAPFGAVAQTQDFEALVEDALRRTAPAQGAPPATAVPPRIGVNPAEPPPGAPPSPNFQAAPAEAGPRPYTPPRNARAPAEAAPAGQTAAPAPAEAAPAPDAAEPAAAAAAPATERNLASLKVEEVNGAVFAEGAKALRGASPLVLKAQVLLDRAGASPGVIDAYFGSNVAKAIAAVETVLDLPVDGQLDPEVWGALGGDRAASVLIRYTITEEDASYPFLRGIPSDYAEQARLPALGYTSPEEMFAERFHMDLELLTALNSGADFRRPGSSIWVAAIEGQPVTGKISRIEADKARRQVRAYDSEDRLVVAYPATIGSPDNPSPSGTHAVQGVAPNPVYYYNPRNFVQAGNTEELQLPPGPNSPVGTIWIDLSEPSYGIHGTPEPSKIDKTASHGCVRLTNWDAEELATLVEPGVTVEFVE